MDKFKELSLEETQEVNGGIRWELDGALIVAAAVEIIGDWDNFKRGIQGLLPVEK